MKKTPLKIAAAVACSAAAASCQGSDKQPNVIIMIADDVSASDFGCYGSPNVHTPNIDRLASEGVRFTNAILSTSSSSPSRCSIITGRYPHNTGACELHGTLDPSLTNIAGLLRANGYYTAQAGKWHFGEAKGGIRQDFDVSGKGKIKEDGVSGSERWIQRLEERPADKPFFMWLASHDAHRPWDNDQSMERYDPESLEVSHFYVDDAPTREDLANYYYEVSRFDRSVGQVVDELKKQGIYDDTMIIIMADNGRPFPRAKTRLIMEGIRTPLIVHYPKMMKKTAGQVCNSLVSVIDIAPTVAEAAGAQAPDSFQGRSFLSLLSAPEKEFRTYAFAEHNWHDYEAYERMVCTQDCLLIENGRPELNAEGAIDIMSGGAGQSLLKAWQAGELDPMRADIFVTPRSKTEMYFYRTDLEQLENLSETDTAKAEEMLNVLHKWQEETCDDLPDDLTHDWYSRTTMENLEGHGVRGTMPGSASGAVACRNSGAF